MLLPVNTSINDSSVSCTVRTDAHRHRVPTEGLSHAVNEVPTRPERTTTLMHCRRQADTELSSISDDMEWLMRHQKKGRDSARRQCKIVVAPHVRSCDGHTRQALQHFKHANGVLLHYHEGALRRLSRQTELELTSASVPRCLGQD